MFEMLHTPFVFRHSWQLINEDYIAITLADCFPTNIPTAAAILRTCLKLLAVKQYAVRIVPMTERPSNRKGLLVAICVSAGYVTVANRQRNIWTVSGP